jgi:SET domain-containing protein
MLLIKTYLDKSKIQNAGIGCFASEFVEKGAKIWRFNPFFDLVYTEENLINLSALEYQFVMKYSFRYNNLYYLCIDNARFFNHCKETPNTYDPINELATYAATDINIGDEILSDYTTFGANDIDIQHNLNGI